MIDRRRFLAQTGMVAPLWLAGFPTHSAAADASVDMLVHGRVPHNAETRLAQLIESWITPNERFYIRSHAPAPKIKVEDFQLSVEGMVERPLQIGLDQLQNEFPKQTSVVTMTCAGNRRSEHSLVKTVGGVPWQAGAIGNAEWAGARLSDLLQAAGIKRGAKHVWFEGLDEIKRPGGVIPFGASIPLEKALSDSESMPGALAAYEMHGKPLSPDHGFPLRTVVPGYIGARGVKWLGKIVLRDRPSPNHYVAKAYKLVTDGTDDEWSGAPPIESFVINSVTCVPMTGTGLRPGKVTARGYALAPGLAGRTVTKVELSTDGGQVWTQASFTTTARPFCWRLWKAELDVSLETSELVVRATDSAGNLQPESVAWNLKGYLFNAWHRTQVQVQ